MAVQKDHGFGPEHSRWHHAAVYIGERFICEARVSGTRYHPVDDLVVDHKIRVRRDTGLTGDERYKIAIRAMMRLNRRYDYRPIIGSWIQTLPGRQIWGKSIRRSYSRQRAIQCTHLFHNAYQGGYQAYFGGKCRIAGDASGTEWLQQIARCSISVV